MQGDPEIDTSKVDSTAKVTDYDEETQGALRKIMVRDGAGVSRSVGDLINHANAMATLQFDQQQKARGLPTSEELQMQALLEKASLLPGSPFVQEEERGGGRAGGPGL